MYITYAKIVPKKKLLITIMAMLVNFPIYRMSAATAFINTYALVYVFSGKMFHAMKTITFDFFLKIISIECSANWILWLFFNFNSIYHISIKSCIKRNKIKLKATIRYTFYIRIVFAN